MIGAVNCRMVHCKEASTGLKPGREIYRRNLHSNRLTSGQLVTLDGPAEVVPAGSCQEIGRAPSSCRVTGEESTVVRRPANVVAMNVVTSILNP
jgi:hypothetical protein